ncbi:YncE family protein [Planosporangium mesophilum]|uniref:Uncharacterized protein n=1 Tax=Planosporangium mesophilum TaxID=689768 RepID=A0A8J3T740_9ACTN|nr:YncE family protein [Planosporangium mesophilum]NJC85641.1 YncE family protein [Planosporangium mesophilum]GII21463.1 hypothetical protein Pme01_10600 [Planosporangium mesophilum]
MTTRRQFLTIAGGAACLLGGGAALAASRRPKRPGDPSGVPDPLLVETTGGLATVRGTDIRAAGAAVCAPDGRTLYAAASTGAGATDLTGVHTATGQVIHRHTLAGRWVPRVASAGGAVALTAADEPAGRERTTIVIADGAGEKRRLELPGNYEPDAFRTDDEGLFVLDRLPPTGPDRYRVRMVDLGTGAPGPLLGRDKTPVPQGAEEEMRGERRQAVYAPDGGTLYTLYTHQPDHQHTRDLLAGGRRSDVHAFVHVLNLVQGWAYCLDLPEPFGHGPAAGHTLAVSPDGTALYVADLTSGRLTVADTELLTVQRVVPVPTGSGTACTAVSPDGGRLFLGADSRVYAVDLATPAVASTWQLGGEVRGLATSRDGARLYAGRPGAVSWHDPATGAELGRHPVAGLTGLRRALLPLL